MVFSETGELSDCGGELARFIKHHPNTYNIEKGLPLNPNPT